MGASKGFFVIVIVTIWPEMWYAPFTPEPAKLPEEESPLNWPPFSVTNFLTFSTTEAGSWLKVIWNEWDILNPFSLFME